MKILHLSHKVPWPPVDGGSVAIYSAMNGLIKKGISVKILAVNPSRDRIDPGSIPGTFSRQTGLVTIDVDTRLKPIHAFVNLFTNRSYFVERFRSESFRAALIRILKNEDFDIIQLEHLYMCLYLGDIRKYSKAAVILRPQNVEHMVWQNVLMGLKHPVKRVLLSIAVKRLRHFETEAAKKVDGILAISPGDEKKFKPVAAGHPVIHVPVGFDFDRLKDYDIQKQYANFPSIYHLGSMDWQPNEEAIRWFLDEIYPKLREALPELPVFIAGKKMPDHFLSINHPKLHIRGMVPDALKFQEDKPILIVPLLSGGGIRAKIIEAMALGKAIITTSKGIEGIECNNGKEVIIADSPEEFVKAILKVATSKEKCLKIGSAARQFALDHFSIEKCATAMIQFYRLFTGFVNEQR